MDAKYYRNAEVNYDHLSLRDLLDARDVYHVHLMNHPHVVATAIGQYRIRVEDSLPDIEGRVKHKGTGRRTLANSEVRPYSWPAILVFVDEWLDEAEFSKEGTYSPDQIVPKTLYLPDGRKVPVCVILVEKVAKTLATPNNTRFPLNNIGAGRPIGAIVQGRSHVATIACLVSDGHKKYALTNRHVSGDPGECVYSKLDQKDEPVGVSSSKQLTRELFSDIYPEWPGKRVYLNLDAGLIEINNVDNWAAKVPTIGIIGRLVDLNASTISLSLIGCNVVGIGASSGRMEGEVCGLFYRYKSVGGFEYVADFLIGPRAMRGAHDSGKKPKSPLKPLTSPGDSGTLWMFDPQSPKNGPKSVDPEDSPYRPFGMQWGAQVFEEGGDFSYVLATSLGTICSLLDVELVRDWNLDQTDTWGSLGHFSIATSVVNSVTNSSLKTLMQNNSEIISPGKDEIISSEFKGMGTADFVPLADVPDMFWKPRVSKQGYSRPMEGPNHFADMDQVRPEDGMTLLELTKDDAFIDPLKWNEFYTSVHDLLSGDKIAPVHRGLLPFRVWQIFNEMVSAVKAGKVAEFVCAAGVLTHYVGDACQPLHISYLHDGDPEDPQFVQHTRKGESVTEKEPNGSGVHSAYEDGMIHDNRHEILTGLANTPKVKKSELISPGFDAAKRTIQMMRTVFERIPPRSIVDFYVNSDAKPKQLAKDMWSEFGAETIECMKDGVHLLAVLWQSAWIAGDGDSTIPAASRKAITKQRAMKICQDPEFVPSMSITQIATVLTDHT